MLSEPNHRQPVPFVPRLPQVAPAVNREDDGTHGGPGDLDEPEILEARVSHRILVGALRPIDRRRHRRAPVGRPAPRSEAGTGPSRAALEFPVFEQGGGV
jgi:hypothetical protein